MSITISQSVMKSVLSCEQKCYYAHVKHIEKKKWKRPFLEGNLFQFGIYQIMIGKPMAVVEKEVEKMLNAFVLTLRKDLSVSPQDEKEFVEIKSSMIGMLRGYAETYKRDLKIEKHVGNEVNLLYPITSDIKFGCQMDNIIAVKGKWYLHEGKAWKYLGSERMNALAADVQINVYYHIHNHFYKKVKVNGKPAKPFNGVIFDAVQKPSIRQKTTESYRKYLKRLGDYYTGLESANKFFKEIIEPTIKYEDLLHTIKVCAKRYQSLVDGKTPVKSFSDCTRYDGCDFYELCFNGETKQNLKLYRQSTYQDRYE